MTMPRAVPSTQFVEKKQRFWVSSGFSLVNSVVRLWGSDSPISHDYKLSVDLQLFPIPDHQSLLGNHVLEGFHDLGTFGFLEVGETSSHDNNAREHCAQYATKQRIAPIHSRIENPPKSCLQNLTHSGVVRGGVRAFGPFFSKIWAACALGLAINLKVNGCLELSLWRLYDSRLKYR
ncbi:hypothetical protein E2320_018075 [Naja naja]|nr:hypothetical protein E2320_018075 [Naja naja]